MTDPKTPATVADLPPDAWFRLEGETRDLMVSDHHEDGLTVVMDVRGRCETVRSDEPIDRQHLAERDYLRALGF